MVKSMASSLTKLYYCVVQKLLGIALQTEFRAVYSSNIAPLEYSGFHSWCWSPSDFTSTSIAYLSQVCGISALATAHFISMQYVVVVVIKPFTIALEIKLGASYFLYIFSAMHCEKSCPTDGH